MVNGTKPSDIGIAHSWKNQADNSKLYLLGGSYKSHKLQERLVEETGQKNQQKYTIEL